MAKARRHRIRLMAAGGGWRRHHLKKMYVLAALMWHRRRRISLAAAASVAKLIISGHGAAWCCRHGGIKASSWRHVAAHQRRKLAWHGVMALSSVNGVAYLSAWRGEMAYTPTLPPCTGKCVLTR